MTHRRLIAALRLSTAVGALLPLAARANPQGGQVSAGNATITQTSPTRVDINQTSNRAVIDWRSFSIGSGEQTNFQQPSATAIILNRVNGGDPSQILGRLSANGEIVIVNPSGVLIGAGAHVDVNGLIATTTNISNANFMAGRMVFDQPSTSPNATVVNQGAITVKEGGLVALVAPGVVNAGVINARLGKVSLVSANSFTVDLYGDRLISIAVDDAVARQMLGPDGQPLAAAVANTGKIVADGGTVQLSARAAKGLLDNVINMTGIVQARAVNQTAGEIVLDGGPSGVVNVTGTLDATGTKPGETGGKVTVLGQDIALLAGAKLDASGTSGGGQVLVGGDQQGKGPLPNATAVYVDPKATIAADATNTGNGGKVVVWSDNYTNFNGTISARGGPNGGNGGSVETSSKNILAANGTVDASAPNGKAGTWLLDPYDVTITNATGNGSLSGGNPDMFTPSASGATVNAATIVADLQAGTNVTIQTTGTGAEAGNITIAAPINVVGPFGPTLTLNATGSITVAAGITADGPSIMMNAGGGVAFNGTINLQSGNLNVTANGAITQTAPIVMGSILNSDPTATFSAGANPITLTQSNNAFWGDVGFFTTGNNAVQFTNSTATALGRSQIGGNFSITSGTATAFNGSSITQAVDQVATLTVGGTTTIALSNANSSASLGTWANNFTGPVGFGGVLGNIQDVSIRNVNAGASVPNISGLTNLQNLSLEFDNTAVALPAMSLTNLSVTAGGAITQTGALNIGLTSTFITGAFPITLTQAGNRFTEEMVLINTGANDIQVTNSLATILNTVQTAGNLTLTGNGISQVGVASISVGGTSTFNTGGQGLSLNEPEPSSILNSYNTLVGTITISNIGASSVQLTNNVATTLTSFSAGGYAIINSNGALNITGSASAGNYMSLTASGAINLAGPVTTGNSLSATASGAITANGTMSAGTSLTVSAGGGFTAATGVTAGTSLSATANGAISIAGPVTVGTTSAFNAGSNAITLSNSANSFAGSVSLSNSGANDVQLVNGGATILGLSTIGGNLSLTSGGSLSQSGSGLTVAGTTTVAVTGAGSDILLDVQQNNLAGAITIAGNQTNVRDLSIYNTSATATTPTLSGLTNLRNLTIYAAAANVSLSSFTASGTVGVFAAGSITQTGAATVAGSSYFEAGYGNNIAGYAPFAITLTQGGNRFVGLINFTNGAGTDPVQITNSVATSLGNSSTYGNITITSGGSISEGSNSLVINGTTTLIVTAANSDVLLGGPNALNGAVSFAGTQSNIRDVTLRNTSATASAPTLSGLTNLRNLTLQHDNAAITLSSFTASGAVSITADGTISQTGAASVAGPTTLAVTAPESDILLGNQANSFNGSVSVAGVLSDVRDFALRNTSATAVVPVLSGLTNLRNVTLTFDNTGAALGAFNAGGSVSVTANGAITQSGALTVAGASSFNAGANAITLTQSGNGFGGPVSFATSGANNVQLVNATTTTLGPSTVGGSLSVASGGALGQSGSLTVAGTSSFSASGGAIALNDPGNQLGGAVTLSNTGGAATSLTNAAPLTLAASTVGGDLTLQADSLVTTGAVTLSGSLTVMPLSVGTNVRLGGSGAFAGLDLNDAQLTQFSGYTALTVGASSGTGMVTVATPESFGAGISLTLQAGGPGGVIQLANPITLAGGAMTFNGAVALGTSIALTTTANGAAGGSISFNGAVSGAGQTLSLTAGSGDIQFAATVGAGAPLGTITVASAHDLTAQASVAANQFTQLAGTGTTDFRGAGLTVGTGNFTGNRFFGIYNAGSLTINSNQTLAFGTVDGVSGPAAAALIQSSGSASSQLFNGAPFGTGGLSGAAATALFVQVGTNSTLDIVRNDRDALAPSPFDPDRRQIDLDSELQQGDVDLYLGNTFGTPGNDHRTRTKTP